MLQKILIIIVGIIIYPFNRIVGTRSNVWIFGSQNGESFIDNSKYFFQYLNANHKEINAVWLTRSKNVVKELRRLNYRVFHNLSLQGIWYALTAEMAFFCTMRSDLLFVFPKGKRRIVNLWHGMPMKKIAYDYSPHKPENKNWKAKLWDAFAAGIRHKEVFLIPATSEFFNNILASAFRNKNTVALGQPRTDAFYTWDKSEIREKFKIKENEIVITYMPTHRAYGKGQPNPKVFEKNIKAINYFKKNNIKFIWKFHKNMSKNHHEVHNIPENLVDLTLENIDPQELIYISDILITDYSSCYIDYLLLRRPVIFYHYDDYAEIDNELYFNPKDHNVGPVASNEDELLKIITDRNKQVNQCKVQYHKYYDGNACQRIYEFLVK